MNREEIIKRIIDEAETEGPLKAASDLIWYAIPKSELITWNEFRSIVRKVSYIDFLLRDSLAQNYTELRFVLEKFAYFLNRKSKYYKADWINTCIYMLGYQLGTMHSIFRSIKEGELPTSSRFEDVIATKNAVCFEDKPTGFHEVIKWDEEFDTHYQI